MQNGRNWWNWSFRCQFITSASILHGKILFRRLFRILSLWFTQMHHNASNKGYRPTFTLLSTDFGPSDNRLFVLSCSYWSQSYSSGAIRSKEQWITYLGHTFYLNLIILSFFPKYAEWHFDRTYFFHSGLKRETPGRGHSRFIANGCHPLKSRLRSCYMRTKYGTQHLYYVVMSPTISEI